MFASLAVVGYAAYVLQQIGIKANLNVDTQVVDMTTTPIDLTFDDFFT
jgi:hypothetical protein